MNKLNREQRQALTLILNTVRLGVITADQARVQLALMGLSEGPVEVDSISDQDLKRLNKLNKTVIIKGE